MYRQERRTRVIVRDVEKSSVFLNEYRSRILDEDGDFVGRGKFYGIRGVYNLIRTPGVDVAVSLEVGEDLEEFERQRTGKRPNIPEEDLTGVVEV